MGDVVAAIGFPIGGPITLTQGGVSGLHRSIRVEGQPRHDMIETDAAVNPGNSGGPLLEPDGTVIGLVDALDTAANGIAYAVPATQATNEVAGWQASPTPVPAANCATPLGPRPAAPPVQRIPTLSAAASAGIADALSRYFRGINSGNYRAAYRVFSPVMRSHFSEQSFADGDSTSYDFDQTILDATQLSPREATVALSFTSLQAPDKGPDHDSCDVWTISYDMVEQDYSWYINSTEPHGPTTHTSC